MNFLPIRIKYGVVSAFVGMSLFLLGCPSLLKPPEPEKTTQSTQIGYATISITLPRSAKPSSIEVICDKGNQQVTVSMPINEKIQQTIPLESGSWRFKAFGYSVDKKVRYSGDFSADILASATASVTIQLKSIVPPPVITNLKLDKSSVAIGSEATLTAIFDGETCLVTPGNYYLRSGFACKLKPTEPTDYTVTVYNSEQETVSEKVRIGIYLDKHYQYIHYGWKHTVTIGPRGNNQVVTSWDIDVESHYTFYSTGIGNYTYRSTSSTNPKYLITTFTYEIKGSKIDICWTKGEFKGTHSTIDSYSQDCVTFEGRTYMEY